MVTHLLDYCGKDHLKNISWYHDGIKYRNENAYSFIEKQGLCSSGYVDDKKMARRRQNLSPMWKKLMKLVDLGEPTSFLDHVYLGCTQCECTSNESIIDEYGKMFESRISVGATEKLLGV